jgi:uncharacterized protein with HEPN domain
MLDAIVEIQAQTRSISLEEFSANTTLHKAVLYNFIIIGEAANAVPQEIQARYPNVPWRDARDLRNVMTHEYFQVSLRLVWKTIHQYLDPLATELEQILKENTL